MTSSVPLPFQDEPVPTAEESLNGLDKANLPFDVLATIVEQVGMVREPDFDLLKVISVTCHLLRPVAQKFLYRKVKLLTCSSTGYSTDTYRVGWKRMAYLVKTNPHISAFVQTVHFRMLPSVPISTRLLNLLSGFTNLKELLCGFYHDDRSYTGWRGLSKAAKRRWRQAFERPSVETLKIQFFQDLPVSILLPCVRLKSLRIQFETSFGPPELNLGCTPFRSFPSLNDVETDQGIGHLAPLFEPHPTFGVPLAERSQITGIFPSSWTDEDRSALKGFTSLTELRKFSLSPHSKSTILCDSVHPDALAKLQYLDISIFLDDELSPLPSTIISSATRPNGGLPALSRIKLFVSLTSTTIDAAIEKDIGLLDALLASTVKLPRLQELTFLLSMHPRSSGSTIWNWRQNDLVKRMPLVSDREGCTFEAVVGHGECLQYAMRGVTIHL